MSMSDRAWRQSRSLTSTTGARELYPTDSAGPGETDELFKLPSVTKAFQVTIPDGAFAASAGTFVVGLLKLGVHYVFSQRRTDISEIITNAEQRIRNEER